MKGDGVLNRIITPIGEQAGENVSQQTETPHTVSLAEVVKEKAPGAKLPQRDASRLEARLIPSLEADQSLIVLNPNPIQHDLAVLVVAGSKGSPQAPSWIILPTMGDVARFHEAAAKYGISAVVEKEDAASKVAESAILLGTPESLSLRSQEKAEPVPFAAFVGLDAHLPNLPSAEIEGLVEVLVHANSNVQLLWLSRAIPLALTGAIRKFWRERGAEEVEISANDSVQLEHVYYELGRDVMAKPNALCDLIEIAGKPRTLIYTNSPSDADLVEVLLTRRGIPSRKLVGRVPDRAVTGAMSQIDSGEIRCLVVTDISASTLSSDDFEIMVHYSTPEDPEVYLHRVGDPGADSRLKKVISLVSSVDLGNFHYLRKIMEFEFEKEDLPSQAELSKLQFRQLAAKALETSHDEYAALAGQVISDEKSERIVAYLLHLALDELPAKVAPPRRGRDKREFRRDEDRPERGERPDRNERPKRDEYRRPSLPPKKDVRIYIGKGLEAGFDSKALDALLAGADGENFKPSRTLFRGLYSFADFPEEIAEDALRFLTDKTESDGSALVIQKAAMISTPRTEEEKGDESTGDDTDTHQGEDDGDVAGAA